MNSRDGLGDLIVRQIEFWRWICELYQPRIASLTRQRKATCLIGLQDLTHLKLNVPNLILTTVRSRLINARAPRRLNFVHLWNRDAANKRIVIIDTTNHTILNTFSMSLPNTLEIIAIVSETCIYWHGELLFFLHVFEHFRSVNTISKLCRWFGDFLRSLILVIS